MGLPISIEAVIKQQIVENTRLDYKRDWNPEENGMPKFPITGLNKDSLDKINKELLQYCNEISPRYLPVVEQVHFDGKEIIVIWCPGGEARPYKAPDHVYYKKGDKKEFSYYIRKMSNSIKANQLEEKELMLLANNVPYDDRVNYQAKIPDLKSSLIQEFLNEVGSNLYEPSLSKTVEEVGADMRIIGGPTELRKPLNVGLMFFNDAPDKFFPYARIEVVDKPDPTGEGMTEKIFTGPLDRQLKDSLSYIKNYIIKEKISKVRDEAEAIRIYNYPYAAIEEALCNAVYHKSYQIGEPVTVMITPEKMEITSLPGPDRTITDEDLKNYHLVSKRYRNRRIGDFLKELKLIEGRNTGIPTILRALKNNGSEPPIFETDEERSFFTITLPVNKEFLSKETKDNGDVKKTIKTRRSSSEIKYLILDLLAKEGRLSKAELVRKMGYAKLTDTVSNAIGELIAEQKIKYTEIKLNSKNQKLILC